MIAALVGSHNPSTAPLSTACEEAHSGPRGLKRAAPVRVLQQGSAGRHLVKAAIKGIEINQM